jgi:hypothetical protein
MPRTHYPSSYPHYENLSDGTRVGVHAGLIGYTVYQDRDRGHNSWKQVRRWINVDELTMRCIVEALKQDPRAGMEESDG